MRSVNEKKPINILTEYLLEWIRRNSDEALPYCSFEAEAGIRIGQKDIERWVFNCNYLYYRIGDFLFDNGIAAQADIGSEAYAIALGNAFKTIKDSNPLNLRSRQDDAILADFAKDWPPFASSSRNKLANFNAEWEAFPHFVSENTQEALQSFRREMENESHYFTRELEKRTGNAKGLGGKSRRTASTTDIRERAAWLLPIWTAKEINPLYSLLIWEDTAAIEELALLLKNAFERLGYPAIDGSYRHESFIGSVTRAQELYLDALGSDDESTAGFAERPVRSIAKALDEAFFSLEQPCTSTLIPRWLYGKTVLIWNVVICCLLGPKEAVGAEHPGRTATVLRPVGCREAQLPDDRGDIILRRHYRTRDPELVGRVTLTGHDAPFLWKVLGSEYDKNASIPRSSFKAEYRNLAGRFMATRLYGMDGDILEGNGDSRYHAELYVQADRNGTVRLFLRDLESKNGTWVEGERNGARKVFVLKSRATRNADEARDTAFATAEEMEFVTEMPLERGDFIHLCDSCFEVI